MTLNSDDAVKLVIALMWPLVVLVLAIVFRRALTALIESAAGLVRGGLSKVSLPGGFAFELVKTTEFKVDWSGPGGQDLRNTIALGQPASGVSDILGLLKPLTASQSADYAVFDLGSGDKWLTSRLHLFSLLLRRMHGLRYCVFVDQAPQVLGRSLGFATAEAVRWSLALRYPHLERAAHLALLSLVNPMSGLPDERITSRTGALDPQQAPSFIDNYLQSIQVDLFFSSANLEYELEGFAASLRTGTGLSEFLRSQLPPPAVTELNNNPKWSYQLTRVSEALNTIIQQQPLYDEARFAGTQLKDETKNLAAKNPEGDDRILLNRLLLAEAYPRFIKPFVLPAKFESFNNGDWVKLETPDATGTVRAVWERARWLNQASITKLLGSDLGHAQVQTAALQAASRKDQVSIILRAEGPMVAIVGPGDRFERLIDRLALAGRAIEFTL